MARVRLNSGGLNAAQVRMGSRGASERLRPPGDDINSSDGRQAPLVCGHCGGTKKVDTSRPHRCATCRADEQLVKDVQSRLKAAGQPPLGKPHPSTSDFAKLRKQGEAAMRRLASRRRPSARRQPSPAAPTSWTRTAPRRVDPGQKKAGLQRLKARLEKLERELTAMPHNDPRREQLREDLRVARRLLADWQDGVH